MSVTETDRKEGWVQGWSIDRKQRKKKASFQQNPQSHSHGHNRGHTKIIKEKIPDIVSQMLVEEILTLVGNHNWNEPENVAKTIADMMGIDLNVPIENQIPRAVEIDRTVFVPANKGGNIPYWIAQSIIRVDEKFGNRFIDYKGAKYNKIDIIFESEYFKEQMDIVAKEAHCTWNARWGNAKKEENRLYQKTRTGSQSDESWLDRCVKHLLTPEDTEGINIKNLVMIEFKRDLDIVDTIV
jgi:hypothetical protein